MHPYFPVEYTGQVPRNQQQNRRKPFPARTSSVSGGSNPGQGRTETGYRSNMAATLANEDRSRSQTARAQQAPLEFGSSGPNGLESYPFNPAVSQPADTMLFAGNDPLSLSQFQQNREVFSDQDAFNLSTAFEPSSFTSSMEAMTAFQPNFSGSGTLGSNDITFPFGYDVPGDTPSQSLDMLFSNTPFVSLPQTSMQTTTSPEQLATQHNWVDMSNFNLSLPGQRLSSASSLENQTQMVTLPRRSPSVTQPQAMSPYLKQQMSKPTIDSPAFRNPFIPPGELLYLLGQ
jgi:hypothetical protein